jgi:hypothetical protein
MSRREWLRNGINALDHCIIALIAILHPHAPRLAKRLDGIALPLSTAREYFDQAVISVSDCPLHI